MTPEEIDMRMKLRGKDYDKCPKCGIPPFDMIAKYNWHDVVIKRNCLACNHQEIETLDTI